MLYSKVPVAPLVVAVTVKVEVPPLHNIGVALEVAPVILQSTPAITSMEEAAELSAVLSPATEVPAAHVVPLPKLILPTNEVGGAIVTPCTFNIITRLVAPGIASPLLHKRSCEPVLDKIDQPVGRPVCNAFAKNVTDTGT